MVRERMTDTGHSRLSNALGSENLNPSQRLIHSSQQERDLIIGIRLEETGQSGAAELH